MLKLHHAAIATKDFDKYVELFENLGMSVQKTRGEKPQRQLWFNEGIQINEITEGDDAVDHIALGVDSFDETLGTALENGCSPIEHKDHWFKLPNGIKMEMMQN